jgi:O-acetyl-ADP-ribose deacetylase (regulator of RNase III)
MQTEVKFIKGNIFTTSAQTLVNTVNCVGIMGAGIALEFKYRYPAMYEKYVSYCRQNLIEIGKLWIYDVPHSYNKILNFPTKKHWKYPSKYEYLEKGLKRFVDTYRDKNISSIAFPLLGAQNGGLDPEEVKKMMYHFLKHCDIPIEIYEYSPSAKDDLYDVFVKAFNNNTIREFEKKTGVKKSTLLNLKQCMDHSDINSMAQLVRIKGVGEETAKLLYLYAVSQKDKLVLPETLFSEGTSIGENTKADEPLSSNSVAEEMQSMKLKTDPSKTNTEESEVLNFANRTTEQVTTDGNGPLKTDSTIMGREMLESPKSLAKNTTPKENNKKTEGETENCASPTLEQKNKVRKKRTAKSITLDQKILYTGLAEHLILQIEAADKEVKISDILCYCEGMKINFKTFLLKQYAGKVEKKSEKKTPEQ